MEKSFFVLSFENNDLRTSSTEYFLPTVEIKGFNVMKMSSELEVDGYDLVRLDRSRGGAGVACYIKSSTAYSYSFCSNKESTFVDIFFA